MRQTEMFAQHACKTRRLNKRQEDASMKAQMITWMLAILPTFASMWFVTA